MDPTAPEADADTIESAPTPRSTTVGDQADVDVTTPTNLQQHRTNNQRYHHSRNPAT